MAAILAALGGAYFLVLALRVRAARVFGRTGTWLLFVAGLSGLATAYVMITWQEPAWIRIGTPVGALVGGVAATLMATRRLHVG